MWSLQLVRALKVSFIVSLILSSAATDHALDSEQTYDTNPNAKLFSPCLDGCRPLMPASYYHAHAMHGSESNRVSETARPRSNSGRRSRHLGSPVDLVVAHCCERLSRWLPALVARHPGAFAHVIVYSKCTTKPTSRKLDCNASVFLESWDRFAHRAQQAERRLESMAPAPHYASTNLHNSRSSNATTYIQKGDGNISSSADVTSDLYRRLLRKQSLPAARSDPNEIPARARSESLEKRQASYVDEPVVLAKPLQGHTYLPPPLSIIKVAKPTGGRSTDECGAYLTHLSKVRPFLRHANTQGADQLHHKDRSVHRFYTINGSAVDSGVRSKEASGALLVHGLPSEHWNLTLIDALLQLAITPIDQHPVEKTHFTQRPHNNQHHHSHRHNDRHAFNGTLAAANGLASSFLSLTRDMWSLSEWPGNSMVMTTGGCMRSLVSAAHLEPSSLHSHNISSSSSGSTSTFNHDRSTWTGDGSSSFDRESDKTEAEDSSALAANPSEMNTRWEASPFVAGIPMATAYSNAMFFVGYDVVRQRPPAFWEAARDWIFRPDFDRTKEHTARNAVPKTSFSKAVHEKADSASVPEGSMPTSRAKDCEGGGRRRKGRRAPLECRLLERTWHTLFCQPCTQPPREMDSRLPPELRVSTRSYHPPSLEAELFKRFANSNL